MPPLRRRPLLRRESRADAPWGLEDLVTAVVRARDWEESSWIEWKGTLDLQSREDKAVMACCIVSLANPRVPLFVGRRGCRIRPLTSGGGRGRVSEASRIGGGVSARLAPLGVAWVMGPPGRALTGPVSSRRIGLDVSLLRHVFPARTLLNNEVRMGQAGRHQWPSSGV